MENIIALLKDSYFKWEYVLSIFFIILFIILSRALNNINYKRLTDKNKYYLHKKRLNYFFSFSLLIILIIIWSDSSNNLSTYMGLLSAGIAIALKEIFTNIVGWFFIELRKPFDVGHRIVINNIKGDVIDKRLFQFSIMEVNSHSNGEHSTGRIIDIPNSFVFIHAITNYTKGFEYIWNEIKVLITFESDWKLAKNLLFEMINNQPSIISDEASNQLKNATKKYMIHYSKLTPIVYTDVKESGIQLSIRYLCRPKQRRDTENKIWEEILEMLKEQPNINLAYPTKRVIS